MSGERRRRGAGAPAGVPRDAPASSRAPTGFPASEAASGARPRAARILVVDDEAPIGAALRRTLRDHEVVVTHGGPQALALLRAGERFDLILCDLMMPGMGGDALYREIQRVAPGQAARVVFLTGGATTDAARQFLATVPNTVIDKPFDVARLRELARDQAGTRER